MENIRIPVNYTFLEAMEYVTKRLEFYGVPPGVYPIIWIFGIESIVGPYKKDFYFEGFKVVYVENNNDKKMQPIIISKALLKIGSLKTLKPNHMT